LSFNRCRFHICHSVAQRGNLLHPTAPTPGGPSFQRPRWKGGYNVVAPESKDVTGPEHVDLLGWVTIQNNSGTDFPEARIKLMAGDVAKLQNLNPRSMAISQGYAMEMNANGAGAFSVTQQAFDDFHLYDLNRTVSLSSGETKQVEFLEASAVTMDRVYEYDGTIPQTVNFYAGYHNDLPTFGTSSNPKVSVRAEIKNSLANHLGIPLLAGRIRLYRRDAGGQMEFIGEGTINHTPTEATVKVPVGSAFDVTGERKQTDFHTDTRAHTTDESYEITVKNQKTVPVNVDVVEHMNRGQNWEITQQSTTFNKRDSTTIELPIVVPPAGQTKVTYSVRYTW
jgi:hypothetical protein